MTKQKPFRVELAVDASRDVVWKALTDPKQLRQWFGWEHPSIADEIEFIFVDGAKRKKPELIELMGGQRVELEPDEARTMVRAVYAGMLSTKEWRDEFDAAEEGWRTNWYQLRAYLEEHRGQARRTVHLEGEARPTDVLALVAPFAQDEPVHDSRYQRAFRGDGAHGHLFGVVAEGGMTDDASSRVTLTITAYGLAPAAFATLRDGWAARWTAAVPNGQVTP